MEKEHLFAALYRTYHVPIREIKNLKDYCSQFRSIDSSKLKIDIAFKTKEELEWALAHPEFDFTSLLPTEYTNSELYDFLKIYYEYILFSIEKYKKGEFVWTYKDLD